MPSRRTFLTVLGGAAVAAAATGTFWATTRERDRAREPWRLAGQNETDPRRRALSYAVLAPNPHNRQPWLADLSVPDEVTLTCQTNRRLPATDPFDRQITIGLGCFLELLAQAARADGFRTTTNVFPEGEPQPRLDGGPVARIRFTPDTPFADPLFARVFDRRTNRGAFDVARSLSPDTLAAIAAASQGSATGFVADPASVAALRTRAWDAMFTEMSTTDTARESVDLLRIGRAEIEASPDGISLAGPLIEALSITGLLSREDMLDTKSATFRQQVATLRVPFDTAMAFLWLTTQGNSRAEQIRAGRDYVRVNLAATAMGVAMQPFSQALQEFPAMRAHYAGMRDALGVAEHSTLQMFVRLGYAPPVKPSPRWPAATRITA